MQVIRAYGQLIAAIAVMGLAALAFVVIRAVSDGGTFEVTADFADTTGLYVGNEVDYLGVPVGKVVSITPKGTVMTVRMRVDDGTTVPRDAAAEILQSALLTDRFVSLGPTYTKGPMLADGAHIEAARTRSPINIDDLTKALDELVIALDSSGPDDKDVGDLLKTTATTLDGNGERIGNLLVTSQKALSTINTNAPDLAAITKNLAILTSTLAERDETVRRFTANLDTASGVLADQSANISATLSSLTKLTTEVSAFLKKNQSLVTDNLNDAAAVAATIQSKQGELARIFDYLPTGAENIWRAYDPANKAIRVQIAARDALLFGAQTRVEFCGSLLNPEVCGLLFNVNGTGLGDALLDGVEGIIPGGL